MTAAKSPVTTSGAVEYAPGIQPWNGHSGSLIRNASANPIKSHVDWLVVQTWPVSAWMLNVNGSPGPWAMNAVDRIAISISRLPIIV